MTQKISSQNNNNLLIGIGLVLFFIVVYVLPLNLRPLAIPDETRYAEIPYEMIDSGNWITPHLNGLRYFEKPPLGYWLNAISISLLGENNFAVRLSTTLAAGITAMLIYFFSLKFFPSRHSSALAAFIYLTFLGIYLLGTHFTLDSLLTLFLTAGIMSYVLATLEKKPGRAWIFWIICGLTLGLAFLTKGFLAFAVPVLVLVPWLIWHHQWHALLIKGWVVVFIAILVVLPWGLLIHLQEGDFWHYFFWVEHIQRFTAKDAQHKEPFYYFIMYFPLLAFPWVSLLPAAIAGLKKNTPLENRTINRLLLIWLLLPFLFFSASSGKLATYILPCFPPLAILMSNGLTRYFQDSGKYRLFKWGSGFNLLVLSILLLAVIYLQFQDESKAVYGRDELPQMVILLTSFVIALLMGGFISFRKNPWNLRVFSILAFIFPVIAILTFATPLKVVEKKAPEKLLLEVSPLIDENTIIISAGSMFRAVNWYLKRKDIYLLTANEVEYGLSYPDAKDRLVNTANVKKMISNKNKRAVAIFCHRDCPDPILEIIPADATRKEFGSFSFVLIN